MDIRFQLSKNIDFCQTQFNIFIRTDGTFSISKLWIYHRRSMGQFIGFLPLFEKNFFVDLNPLVRCIIVESDLRWGLFLLLKKVTKYLFDAILSKSVNCHILYLLNKLIVNSCVRYRVFFFKFEDLFSDIESIWLKRVE